MKKDGIRPDLRVVPSDRSHAETERDGTTKGRRKDGGTDGRSARWTEHRVTRREELIEAAIEAVREYGAGVGMDQIAATARTSKPVIYRYFADKAELFQAIGQQVAQSLLRDLSVTIGTEPDVRTRLRAGVGSYLRVLEQNPQLYMFVVHHRSEPGSGVDFSSLFADLIADDLRRLMFESGLDPVGAMPWGAAIVGFVQAVGEWWLKNPGTTTRDQLGDYVTSLLWSGAVGVYAAAGRPVDPMPAPGVFRTRPD